MRSIVTTVNILKLTSHQYVTSLHHIRSIKQKRLIRLSLHSSSVAAYSRPFSTSTCASGEEVGEIDYYKLDPLDHSISFGDFSTIASQDETGRKHIEVAKFGSEDGPKDGDIVWIRGRVSSVRAKGSAIFVVLRSGSFHTIQACHFKDKSDVEKSKQMMKYTAALPFESIVDIMGVVTLADVKSCSVSNMELHIKKVIY